MTNATEFWIILKSICILCIILYHSKSNVVTFQVAGANGWSRSCWWLLTVFWKRFNGVGGRGTTGRWGKIKKRWLCYSRASKNTKFYKSWFWKHFSTQQGRNLSVQVTWKYLLPRANIVEKFVKKCLISLFSLTW